MPSVRPKYQIFISSTFGDLKEEREAVTWSILSARHIPVGMESFPAADDRGWKIIKASIDRSDYYVLLVAGRYGSVDSTGTSWTQKEYEYALSKGIPVLSFIRSNTHITADQMESDPSKSKKLLEFIKIISNSHMYKPWKTKEELVGLVTNSLQLQIAEDEDSGNMRPGWYRGDELPSKSTIDEFARISSTNARLQLEIDSLRSRESNPNAQFTLIDLHENPILRNAVHTKKLLVDNENLKTLNDLDDEQRWDVYAYNTALKLDLGIMNNGNSIAEYLTIDFTFKNICGFSCKWLGSHLNYREYLSISNLSSHEKPGRPESILRRSDKSASMRFRINRIPAGGTEFLPTFFLIGEYGETPNSSEIFGEYRISANSGAPTKGEFHLQYIFSEIELIPPTILKAKLQSFSSKLDTLDLNDIFIQ